MSRPIAAIISTTNMRHNLDLVTRKVRDHARELNIPEVSVRICAVVKANAYGHGLASAVQAFNHTPMLATVEPESLRVLRDFGWQKDLLLLEGFFNADDLGLVAQSRSGTVVHNDRQLEIFRQAAQSLFDHFGPVNVFLKINSGMNRLGFKSNNFEAALSSLQQLQKQGRVGRVGMVTHLANAELESSRIEAQLQTFEQIIGDFSGTISICNSAASLKHGREVLQRFLTPGRNMVVRPGICLYGGSPMGTTPGETAAELQLLPAMNLRAQIIAVQHLKKGDAVGYGSRYTADRDQTLAVVACGYADGYPQNAPDGTPTTVCGQTAPITGKVSMDMLTINITQIPSAKPGDWVDLWGGEGPHIDELAKACGRSSYELLSSVSARVPRVIQ